MSKELEEGGTECAFGPNDLEILDVAYQSALARLERVRHFPILSGFPNHANRASPLLIVRWGEDYGTGLQPGFA